MKIFRVNIQWSVATFPDHPQILFRIKKKSLSVKRQINDETFNKRDTNKLISLL